MRVSIQNVGKSFGGRDILADFSLEIQSGVRLCVCGANGTGKSTLLRILAGVELPDAGRVVLPKGCRLGYVEQELDETSLDRELLPYVLDVLPDWNDFWIAWDDAARGNDASLVQSLARRQAELEQLYGYNPEHRAKTVLTGLGFSESKWRRPLRELSGGWRERAKLARILTGGADVLLLDEPTNHLDLDAVEWLENFLMGYQGVLIFVAHDRVFMDKISSHILYLGIGKPLFRKGNFSQFLSLQEELEGQKEREAARIQDEIERKMAFVRRFKAKATKARQAGSRQKMAKKLEKELEGLAPAPKRKELSFSWPAPPQSDRTVLAVSDLAFQFPDGKKMWEKLSFTIYRGQKIALAGHNGCGKSTLLRLLTGRLEKTGGNAQMGQLVKAGYFSQHQLETLNPAGTALGEIRRLSDPRVTEEELMSVLGLFLLGQQFFERTVGTLSGGEKSRLILASLFLARCNFLILDEPTNHLDLESREALVEALGAFPGTVLMVAHDRHLLSEAADEIWQLDSGAFTVYDRGYAQYAEARKAASASLPGAALAPEPGAEPGKGQARPALSRDEQKRLKRERAEARNALYKEMKPLQEQYARLEEELGTVLAELDATEGLLADPEVYADSGRATDLLKQFHALRSRSESVMERMAELESRLAAFESRRAALNDDEL
ncbi:MAG: ABC-F family ATP-binding cassette domain-containing protein [Deltaproteobacteria bacterium]|jgi:ATP-binding cassette subfamily F protein 3|nr:ABC-F family ATP-binding cassette domain-containing protein [Deltaproteobacteria bacterium]